MSTLVTGATGMVGSAVVSALVERGESVRILRRETSSMDLLGDLAGRVEHVIGEVTDPVAVEEAMEGIRDVYHIAARIGFAGKKERDRMLSVNVGGTKLIVDAALHAGVRRLVHTSSIAALGRADRADHVMDEQTEWEESSVNTVYGISKHLAELEIHRGVAEGLDAVMVNPSMIFGVGRRGENTREVVDKIRRQRLPAIPRGGNGFVDVLDVAEGHLRAMEHGKTGERYILSSENLTWRSVIYMFAEAFGVQPPRFEMSRPAGQVLASVIEAAAAVFRFTPLITREAVAQASMVFRYSNRKAVEELGCRFRPFSETVDRIVAAVG